MALNDINFIKSPSGLGRPLTGEDHISGLVFYIADANLPSGFSTSDRIKQVFSISQAEGLGIAEGGANTSILWYHINEYFKQNPKGNLFIGLFDTTSIDLSAVETLQNFSDGRINTIAVYNGGTAFATADVQTLQASATALDEAHKPVFIIYAADFQGVADYTTLTNLTTLQSPSVTVVLGEDGKGAGAALAISEGQSVTNIGALLGVISLANVHENVGWVGKFNISDGTENDVPALATGAAAVLVKNLPEASLSDLRDKGYSFVRKHNGNTGTFFVDSFTCEISSSDFRTIENNRVYNKAKKLVRTNVLPLLNSPLTINADGTLSEETIAVFKNAAKSGLDEMLVNNEISQKDVQIDPTQNVLSTSKIQINIRIIPRGVARYIEVNLGFTVNI